MKKAQDYKSVYRRMNNRVFYGTNFKDISYNQIKGCLSKLGYDTEYEAMVFGARRGLKHYKCNFCNHYHLTKGIKRRK